MAIEPFIKCSDIIKSLLFYSETLDFRVVVAPHPDPSNFNSKHAFLERHGDGIHLSAHAGDGVFGSVNYVRITSADQLLDKFKERGLQPISRDQNYGLAGGPVTQSWAMREFWIRDPDGNKLTFGEPAE